MPNYWRAANLALRRYFKSTTESSVVVAGPLSVDLVTRSVLLNDQQIRLTRKEYRLIHVLATHVGLVVTHDHLLKEIWTGNQRDNIQYLRISFASCGKKSKPIPTIHVFSLPNRASAIGFKTGSIPCPSPIG